MKAGLMRFLEERTILLTGGPGFLGSSLLERLVSAGCRVIVLKRTTSFTDRISALIGGVAVYDIDAVPLERVFSENRIDMIIHCATDYGRKEKVPLDLLDANLFLPLKLLELGVENGVSCFINTDTVLDKNISYYSLSKSQFKDWLKLYSNQLTCISVALEHFYGPFDDESKFATFIIRSILRNVERIPLTAGAQRRDFIYIDDVVDAFENILRHSCSLGNGYSDFQVGSGTTVSIRDFVCLVKRISGNEITALDFGALPYREHEVMESSADTSNVRALGWLAKTSLEAGLQQTINRERDKV
jgi:nucleoside-diphosphate-sugar epimerase